MSDVLLEFQRNGAYLKVTAVDAATGTEVSAVGPANDPEAVKRLAILKLKNRLTGNKPVPPASKGGIIV